MREVDMKHMEHLGSVAYSDTWVLERKEATYRGSWKAAGGRSAWFMARRNMDRLIEMMKKPDAPASFNIENVDDTLKAILEAKPSPRIGEWYVNMPGIPHATHEILKCLRDSYVSEDVFAKISEEPSGRDGTVLACMRDLRRYLMLVEAEMIARGVVQDEYHASLGPGPDPRGPKGPTGMKGTYHLKRGQHVCEVCGTLMGADTYYSASHKAIWADGDKYYCCEHVPQKLLGGTIPHGGSEGAIGPTGYGTGQGPTGPSSRDVTAGAVGPDYDPSFTSVLTGAIGEPAEPSFKHEHSVIERRVPRYVAESRDAGAYGTDRDESRHASLAPWQVKALPTSGEAERLFVSHFYKHAAPGVYRLEPFVESKKIPKQIAHCYSLSGQKSDMWIMKVQNVPEELRDCYPRLQLELNAKEHEEHPQRFMYVLDEKDMKHRLAERFQAWGREA